MLSKPFELNYQQGQPYWMVDILWVVLAERATTNGTFSLMWQLCPEGSGPGPHYHDQDEGFFVNEGQITYVAGGEQFVAKQGSFVWIPRSTIHSFRVDSKTATLLNFYTPAGFEQIIMAGGLPAEALTLPPEGLGMAINQSQMMALFEKIGMHVVQDPDVLRAA
ncbi:cupin domain-containing protein [Spirosoma areae]